MVAMLGAWFGQQSSRDLKRQSILEDFCEFQKIKFKTAFRWISNEILLGLKSEKIISFSELNFSMKKNFKRSFSN